MPEKKIDFNYLKKMTWNDENVECKTYLEQKKIEEEAMDAKAEKFWKEMMMQWS